jgi:dodecin
MRIAGFLAGAFSRRRKVIRRHCDERPVSRSLDLGICSPDAIWTDFNALMSDHIYKKIELVGTSPNGIEDAVNNAISRAGKTIRNMSWFEVAEVRGGLENNKVAHWQVTVKVGFTLDS